MPPKPQLKSLVRSQKRRDKCCTNGLPTPSNLAESLLYAASRGNTREINRILWWHKISRGFWVDIDFADQDLNTPAHRASRSGMHVALKMLAAAGANLELRADFGWRCIHLASMGGHTDCVLILLEYKVNFNSIGVSGQNSLHLASECGHPGVCALLLSAGIDADQQDHNMDTPLHIASRKLNIDCLEELLKGGASPIVRNEKWLLPSEVTKSIRAKKLLIKHIKKMAKIGYFDALLHHSVESHVDCPSDFQEVIAVLLMCVLEFTVSDVGIGRLDDDSIMEVFFWLGRIWIPGLSNYDDPKPPHYGCLQIDRRALKSQEMSADNAAGIYAPPLPPKLKSIASIRQFESKQEEIVKEREARLKRNENRMKRRKKAIKNMLDPSTVSSDSESDEEEAQMIRRKPSMLRKMTKVNTVNSVFVDSKNGLDIVSPVKNLNVNLESSREGAARRATFNSTPAKETHNISESENDSIGHHNEEESNSEASDNDIIKYNPRLLVSVEEDSEKEEKKKASLLEKAERKRLAKLKNPNLLTLSDMSSSDCSSDSIRYEYSERVGDVIKIVTTGKEKKLIKRRPQVEVEVVLTKEQQSHLREKILKNTMFGDYVDIVHDGELDIQIANRAASKLANRWRLKKKLEKEKAENAIAPLQQAVEQEEFELSAKKGKRRGKNRKRSASSTSASIISKASNVKADESSDASDSIPALDRKSKKKGPLEMEISSSVSEELLSPVKMKSKKKQSDGSLPLPKNGEFSDSSENVLLKKGKVRLPLSTFAMKKPASETKEK